MSEKMRKVFIGSSREGVEYAKKLKILLDKKLSKYNLQCLIWEGSEVFTVSQTTIRNLENLGNELCKNCGYAIFILTPDDKIEYRGEKYFFPRDNVLFELGLFTGILGRKRTFCVRPSNIKIKMLTDWDGVTDAMYTYVKEFSEKWDELFKNAVKSLEATIDKIERPILYDDTINVSKIRKNTSQPTDELKKTIMEIELSRSRTKQKYNKDKNIKIGGF